MKSIKLGPTLGFLAVALGAFGAHALKATLDEYTTGIWQTATLYLMFHALAIIGYEVWAKQNNVTKKLPSHCFALGAVVFSGSLYLLALTRIKTFGMITPIGGVLFLVGWGSWAFMRVKND